MTKEDILHNIACGFYPSDKSGFSVKKMLGAVATLIMLSITALIVTFDKTYLMPALGVWMPFILAMMVTSAIEKSAALKVKPNDPA